MGDAQECRCGKLHSCWPDTLNASHMLLRGVLEGLRLHVAVDETKTNLVSLLRALIAALQCLCSRAHLVSYRESLNDMFLRDGFQWDLEHVTRLFCDMDNWCSQLIDEHCGSFYGVWVMIQDLQARAGERRSVTLCCS